MWLANMRIVRGYLCVVQSEIKSKRKRAGERKGDGERLNA